VKEFVTSLGQFPFPSLRKKKEGGGEGINAQSDARAKGGKGGAFEYHIQQVLSPKPIARKKKGSQLNSFSAREKKEKKKKLQSLVGGKGVRAQEVRLRRLRRKKKKK